MSLSPQHAGFEDLKLRFKIMSPKIVDHTFEDPQAALRDTGIFNSGCSRHMTRNKSFLSHYQEYDGGFVSFAGSSKGEEIICKGKIKTGKLDFEDVYFVKELKFNLFSVSQMCDKKNSVLFTETKCLVLSPDFKLPDENLVLLKVPRKNNMYSFDLKNVVPSKALTCLFAKATNNESNLWHRRLGHINFKTMNKLVKGNLVRGLPSKIFENDHTCVSCQKGKQHTAFWIKREFSNARTLQQNGVAERKNRSLIKAARTMLADSLLPIPFWAEAVNTACYVQNSLLVTKPHNKTPYELLTGRAPTISFMRPFGCLVTILNTFDHLGKFDGKDDEGFLVGYSINSKAFRVYNSITKKVEENLQVNFLKNKTNVTGSGPKWLFDISSLINSMNYQPVSAGNRTNGISGLKIHSYTGQEGKEKVSDQEYILLHVLNTSLDVPSSNEEVASSPKDDTGKKSTIEPTCVEGGKIDDLGLIKMDLFKELMVNGTFQHQLMMSAPLFSHPATLDDFFKMPNIEDTGIFYDAYDDRDEGAVADYNNLEAVILVSPIPSTNIHKDHPKEQIIREVNSAVQTKKMAKQNKAGWNQRRAIGTKWSTETREIREGLLIEVIMLFLAYASFMDFTVYQMDVKSEFLYGIIEEEVYVSQPLGFVDPEFPNRVYKVEKALYGLHQAPRAWSLSTEFEQLMHNRFQMSSMRELTFFLGLQVKQRTDGIFLSQDKYVCDIFKKFGFSSVKSASTPMEIHKPLSKDSDGTDVDVHLYQSMIGSLIYLTYSRPDIMFAVCACSRFQVQPKVSHMHAVKRIFRYLKGHPTLGLWYPKDSPLELIAYSDSDYECVSLDRKSTTGGFQFLGSRLISWKYKKQTIMANFTTEAEYIAAFSCYRQTKHIEIRHHFIRDSYEKRLIEMAKIHTDSNVIDLLTKDFDVTKFQFLVASIGIKLKGYLLNDGYADLVQNADKKELAIPGQTTTGKEFLNSLMAEPFSSLNHFMANLKFFDQYNMVAYLEKSDDNTEFHQIVDFLSSCSITYALSVSLTIYASYIEQFWNIASSKTVNSVKQIHAKVDDKVVVISESLVRSDLIFDHEDGITCLTNDETFENLALMGYEPLSSKLTFQKDEAVNQEEGDRVERAITTDASLEAAQDIPGAKKPWEVLLLRLDTAIPNDDIPQVIDTGGSPMHQETIGGTSAQTRSGRVLAQPNEPPLTEGHTTGCGEDQMEENIKLTNTIPTPHDSPLTGGYTPRSDEGRITLAELMETCTTLSDRVTQLENELSTIKAVYNKAFITLTNRVKKLVSQLKQKRSSAVIHSLDEEGPSVHIEDSPKQGRIIKEIDKDENINLVKTQGEVQETTEHSRDDDDETLTETLLNIKRSSSKDKRKGTMQETELPKKLKKKEMIQLSLDEELAQKLYIEELAKEGATQEQERYNLEKALELQR
nr:hypothetical protein [Tanacetum cinerariifolium]